MTNNRYGEISINTCRYCGTKWINYLYEYPFFTRGGRYYKGIVTDEKLKELTPGTVAEYLESLDWYFYGGSFFDTPGKIGSGPLRF
jgi:hypothetical protein